MASELRKFLWPNFEKILVFLIFAFMLIPVAYYISKDGIYCYPSIATEPGSGTCEPAQITFSSWHASWMFVITNTFGGVSLISKGIFSSAMALLAVPLYGAMFSYLISCSLVRFIEPKL